MVNKKVKTALKHALTPLVCIGKSHEETSLGVSAENSDQTNENNLI